MARKTVVLGITGGIAAFRMLELIVLLRAKDINVIVIATPSACRIVPPKEFEKASGNKVRTQLFDNNFDYTDILRERRVEHIDIAQSSHLIVIAPATANVMAKLATGIADDYLTTTVLAATCPVMIYPSMNTVMWRNPVTQKNVAALRSFDTQVIAPASGVLACGTEGEGRLPPVGAIADEIMVQLTRTHSLQGKRVLVTAGGTREPIDAVRFLTNRSSGKMGVAIAEECFLRGAQVTLLRSKTSVQPRYPMQEHLFDTADDLERLMVELLPKTDMCFHVAAVSDFTVEQHKGKVSGNASHILRLTPRSKILDRIKHINPNITLIAFKAEANLSDKALLDAAKKRLAASSADYIVANDIGKSDRGFESDDNEVFVIDKKGNVLHIPLTSKRIVAQKILDSVLVRTCIKTSYSSNE